MADHGEPYAEVIAMLLAEAHDLERRAARIREAVKELRAASAEPVAARQLQLPITGGTISTSTGFNSSVQFIERRGVPSEGRIPTSRILLRELAGQTDGLEFDELVRRSRPHLQSAATNTRKLIHSTVSYLVKEGRAERLPDGRVRLVDQRGANK